MDCLFDVGVSAEAIFDWGACQYAAAWSTNVRLVFQLHHRFRPPRMTFRQQAQHMTYDSTPRLTDT
jgi:O-phosphoseryl-tRNA(Cys) synthetase